MKASSESSLVAVWARPRGRYAGNFICASGASSRDPGLLAQIKAAASKPLKQ